MEYIIDVKDTEAPFVLDLLRRFDFVQVRPADELDDEETDDEPELTKEQLLADVREALEEVKLYKQGKIKLKTLDEFLDEL
jgi:hypothetical protein